MNACKIRLGLGLLTFRPLHPCPRYIFSGQPTWVRRILYAVISRHARLSIQVLQQARAIEIPRNSHLAHADLADFFMHGAHDFIVNHVDATIGCAKRDYLHARCSASCCQSNTYTLMFSISYTLRVRPKVYRTRVQYLSSVSHMPSNSMGQSLQGHIPRATTASFSTRGRLIICYFLPMGSSNTCSTTQC